MEGHLMMSAKERRRLLVFDRLREEQLSLGEAAGRLDISYRQCLRSYRRYREEGARGLVHRSRGRRSNRAKPHEFRREVIKRYEEEYEGFGPTYAAEKLAEEGFVLDHETLRRWLLRADLWKKSRRRRRHRTRRERKAYFGEMVQLDGSPACSGVRQRLSKGMPDEHGGRRNEHKAVTDGSRGDHRGSDAHSVVVD